MSNFEQATALLGQVPDNKLDCIVSYLQGFLAGINSADTDEIPNAETIAAMKETEEMARNGTGHPWSGSTKEYFARILAGEE